jgi:hypothetical protein
VIEVPNAAKAALLTTVLGAWFILIGGAIFGTVPVLSQFASNHNQRQLGRSH